MYFTLTILTLLVACAIAVACQQGRCNQWHFKVSMPEPRKRDRSRSGFTIPQVIFGIAAILGAHALFAVLIFIVHTVFGMAEPRW